MSGYKDYGYKSANNSCAHVYLTGSILNLLNKAINRTILDVGCGNGSLAHILMNEGYNVYGTDASESGINIARQKYEGRFFVQDLSKDELPVELSGITFDTIISTEVIEHLYDPRRYLSFCKNVLMKNGGGELIISTPYHGYFKKFVLSIDRVDG